MSTQTYHLPERVTVATAAAIHAELETIVRSADDGAILAIDFTAVRQLDSAGIVVLDLIRGDAKRYSIDIEYVNVGDDLQKTIEAFSREPDAPQPRAGRRNPMEVLGEASLQYYGIVRDFIILLSNISYFGVAAFFRPGLRRKGEVIRQSNFIGVSAFPIIALVTFLIGLVLAIQAAVQMRPFGAEIFVAQLVTFAMVMELGPLLTAIMVAGRSGSSIAAELGAMKVSEEIDALRSMGIDPIPYLIIPKLFAILLTMPLLTALANFFGIFGGSVIGYTYLQMDFAAFYNEVTYAIRYYEIMTGFIKSIVFATIIVVVGSYFGLHVEGGAEGVGRATTRSVVVSIFMVIVADSILGLIFYIE
jgi:phospholipid/cholesterol/gamma-HCH transport system permease protein